VLVRRIYQQADGVAARYPEVELVKAAYLGKHPLVMDSFIERIEGIRTGDVNMNCLVCKYRTQVIGHEAAVGAPQEGHHHHVEGIGTGGDHHHHHHHHHQHHHHDHHAAERRAAATPPAR
jgi:sirohydrochlorin cobaltochelatase